MAGSKDSPHLVTLMITGDSMTHGQEGDHTWRYRLWNWLRGSSSDGPEVRFVGPYRGTMEPDLPLSPQPPRFPEEPDPRPGLRVSGEYAADCHPAWYHDSWHLSLWGRAAAQVVPEIEERVGKYHPDYLLVALGFNDLGWFISDEHGLLENMERLVANARMGRSDIKLVLSTVPSRSFIRQDLVDKTAAYNGMIARAAKSWSTDESPIVLAEFEENYSCGVSGCPAGYDGLHPNAMGEYEIARAFSQGLVMFGLRKNPLIVPKDTSEPPPSTPQNVTAASSPMGVSVTWSPVFGSRAYEVRHRICGHHSWDGSHHVNAPRHDITFTAAGVMWEAQVRSIRGATNEVKSDWSEITSAKSTKTAAPPPQNIKVTPLDGAVQVAWLPPPGKWDIDRYEVIFLDTDIPNALITGHPAKEELYVHEGFEQGHRFKVWVATWAFIKGELARGNLAEARPFLPDFGKPDAPQELTLHREDHGQVSLRWHPAQGAAGYIVYKRDLSGCTTFDQHGELVRETHMHIDVDTVSQGKYEYAVSSINGDLESERTFPVR